MAKRFRAQCDDHDWEGAAQNSRVSAEKDLKAHKANLPDEPHPNTRIVEYDV
jgi:hypothetical protein